MQSDILLRHTKKTPSRYMNDMGMPAKIILTQLSSVSHTIYSSIIFYSVKWKVQDLHRYYTD